MDPMRGRVLPKLIVSLIVIVLLVMILKQPDQAADNATGIAGWFSNAADSVGAFFTALIN